MKIAIVDQRQDLLSFLKEKIEAQGYEVVAVTHESEADAQDPDLVLVDFEPQVNLDDVFAAIEEGLHPKKTRSRKR